MKLCGWVVVGAVVVVACGTEPAKAPDGGVPTELAGMPTEPVLAPAKPTAAGDAAGGNAASVGEAKDAAQSWLAQVDAEKYADTWVAAAKGFQSAVSEPDWARAVAGVRRPLGKVVSRQLRSAEYKTSLPGAPDGK